MVELTREEVGRIGREAQQLTGKRIRAIRESLGMTQTQLAVCIQSDRQYMYKIESGKVGVSIAKLAVIAKALGVSLKELVDFQ